MDRASALGEKLLALLDSGSTSSTYKPALLYALIDLAPEYAGQASIPVSRITERVVELYWRQTRFFTVPDDESFVLKQNSGSQAAIVQSIRRFREIRGTESRSIPVAARSGKEWLVLTGEVEETLAKYPIPRLQNPLGEFLYTIDWKGEGAGWSRKRYLSSSRALSMAPGAIETLVSLGPILRPFVLRWWTDIAADFNDTKVEAAKAFVEFEEFMFGQERTSLERIAGGLLEFQLGECFYCGERLFRKREVDHFVPWSYRGDDGIHNLVVSCSRCNRSKSAILAGPTHLAGLLERNRLHSVDLLHLAEERSWPAHSERSRSLALSAYRLGSDDLPIWSLDHGEVKVEPIRSCREELIALLE